MCFHTSHCYIITKAIAYTREAAHVEELRTDEWDGLLLRHEAAMAAVNTADGDRFRPVLDAAAAALRAVHGETWILREREVRRREVRLALEKLHSEASLARERIERALHELSRSCENLEAIERDIMAGR